MTVDDVEEVKVVDQYRNWVQIDRQMNEFCKLLLPFDENGRTDYFKISRGDPIFYIQCNDGLIIFLLEGPR